MSSQVGEIQNDYVVYGSASGEPQWRAFIDAALLELDLDDLCGSEGYIASARSHARTLEEINANRIGGLTYSNEVAFYVNAITAARAAIRAKNTVLQKYGYPNVRVGFGVETTRVTGAQIEPVAYAALDGTTYCFLAEDLRYAPGLTQAAVLLCGVITPTQNH